MSDCIGWADTLPELIAAANAARSISAPFDEPTRRRHIEKKVAEAAKFSWWPLGLGLLLLALPNGWIGLVLGIAVFGVGYQHAGKRRDAVAEELARETVRLRSQHEAEVQAMKVVMEEANRGDIAALQSLLRRWEQACPEVVQPMALSVRGDASGTLHFDGRGLDRARIPAATPRVGRGGRTFFDKRKAGEIDEDLAELNAGAVLTALCATVGGAARHEVAVSLTIGDGDGSQIPWVTFRGFVDGSRLSGTLSEMSSPADGIRRLGGDVGRCRNQRYTPAKEPASRADYAQGAAASASSASSPKNQNRPTVERRDSNTSSPVMTTPPSKTDRMGARASAVTFGEASVATARAGQAIPKAPPPSATPAITISVSMFSPGSGGDFAKAAKKHAKVVGDPNAPFVPFQAYWSTYADMNESQLRFYFRWRTAVRNGEIIPTDLSYIFVHIYELLHLVGAKNGEDAAGQLVRLWKAYRPTYPKLDQYLVPWIADLYATEVNPQAALKFVEGSIDRHSPPSDEVLLVTDRRWVSGDFAGIPVPGLAMLIAERRIGDNKFAREHNKEVDGRPWVEGAYRAAMQVADETFQSANGISLRDATVKSGGLRVITRPAFMGAVYTLSRKDVTLGKVPSLDDTSRSVTIYRGAIKHAENMLRKERGFSGKLRGIELDAETLKAIEACIAAYLRATKPRTKVSINLELAQTLSKESADTRARLLEGIEMAHDELPVPAGSVVSETPAVEPTVELLTDLAAVTLAMEMLSRPARALLAALANAGWEADETSADLSAAVDGVLVGPLVSAINARAQESLSTDLVVREGTRLVVQEDYRDEVYHVINGHLDGFDRTAQSARTTSSGSSATADVSFPSFDGFGPIELQALLAVAGPEEDRNGALATLAMSNASTPLLLLDQVNSAGLASPYGDILVDGESSPPAVLPDAQDYVDALLARIREAMPSQSG